MSNSSLSDEELKNWILSLPPENIRSLEEALKSIRQQHYEEENQKVLSQSQNNTKLIEEKTFQNTSTNQEILTTNNLLNNQTVFHQITSANSTNSINTNTRVKSESNEDNVDISAPSRTGSPTSSNISGTSRNKTGKTYENGRRNLKDENVPEEEAHRRAKRRERNRLAAAKCRKRRQDKIETLQQKVAKLKSEVTHLSNSIHQNDEEKRALDNLLDSHKCNMKSSANNSNNSTSINGNAHSNKRRPNSLPLLGINTDTGSTSSKDNSITTPSTSLPSSNNTNNINNNGLLICSLSPLLTPSTMKLLIDTLVNGNNSNSNNLSSNPPTPNVPIKQELSSNGRNISTSSSSNNTTPTPNNIFSRSLSLLNLLSSPHSTPELINITNQLLQSSPLTCSTPINFLTNSHTASTATSIMNNNKLPK